MIPVVVGFFLGILSLHFFRELPTLYDIAFVILILGFLVALPRGRKLKIPLASTFFLGFLWVLLHAHNVIEQWIPANIESKPIKVSGIIANIPEQQDEILNFELDIKTTIPQSLWAHPGRVKIRWVNPTDLVTVGDEWQFFVRLKRPHGYSNPGSFDRERHLFQNRLVAEGAVVDTLPYHRINSSFFSYPMDRIRDWFKRHIHESLEGRAFSGIITALIIGVSKGISLDQWQVLKNSGTSHLVAISGLHIGLVSGFIFMLTGVAWRWTLIRFFNVPVQWVAALASVTTAILYALLAGFSIPTKRSVVMIVVFMVSILRRRRSAIWRSYFLALAIVLFLDPLSTLSPGFWLSFGAVGFILYGMKGRLKPEGLWWRWGRAQWVVFLGLAPITLAIFNMVSLASPLGNLIAIPWVSFLVVPFSLMGTLSLILYPPIASFFLKTAEYCLSLLWPFLEWISHFPIFVWNGGIEKPVILILLLIAVLLLLAPRGLPGKYVGFIGILPLFLIKPLEIETNKAYVTVLDVGQGLSAVVETKNHVLVFDTGPKLSPRFDTGDQVVLPFLAMRGRKGIDALVISHGDNDHMGGTRSILQAVDVKKIITSEPHLFRESKVMHCHANQRWEWDGVIFEMLHPDSIFSNKRNDHSCVLQVKTKTHSFLLTGDIEAKSEQRLIERMAKKLKATVMLVPHHGSRTSSTLEFIRAVNPKYAIIPVGYKNMYGHPKPDIVERYQKEGITLLDTVHDGAVSFVLGEESDENTMPEPRRYRLENKRYWHFITHADG